MWVDNGSIDCEVRYGNQEDHKNEELHSLMVKEIHGYCLYGVEAGLCGGQME